MSASLDALPAADAARVRRAMADGNFGRCATCGEDITAAALLERPTLAACPECAGALRRGQAGRRFGVCGIKPG